MDLNLLNSELVRDNLLREIIYFDKIESTNQYAKKNKVEDNTLIITSDQTNGIGRFNRIWESSPGKNLTFSIVINKKIGIDELHLVNFYSSYILCITLKKNADEIKNSDISLKWPNDILMNKKKIAGFLLDVTNIKDEIKKFIIGVGINVNQEIFPPEINLKASSIYIETHSQLSLEKLLMEFIINFYTQLDLIENKNKLMRLWIRNSDVIGNKIDFKKMNDSITESATVMDIESDGGLKLQFDNGKIKKFYSGEISLSCN